MPPSLPEPYGPGGRTREHGVRADLPLCCGRVLATAGLKLSLSRRRVVLTIFAGVCHFAEKRIRSGVAEGEFFCRTVLRVLTWPRETRFLIPFVSVIRF